MNRRMLKTMLCSVGLILGMGFTSSLHADFITFNESVGSAVGYGGQTNNYLISSSGDYRVEFLWLGTGGHNHISNIGGNLVEANHNNSAGGGGWQGLRITRTDAAAFTLASMGLFGQASIGQVTGFNTAFPALALYSGSGTQGAPGVVNFGSSFANVTQIFIMDPFAAGGNSFNNGWDNIQLIQEVPVPAGIVLSSIGTFAVIGLGWYKRRSKLLIA